MSFQPSPAHSRNMMQQRMDPWEAAKALSETR
jgi:hypothetical protein